MPLYTFTCPKCQRQTEEVRRYDDRDAPVTCGKDGCTGELRRHAVERPRPPHFFTPSGPMFSGER